MKVLTISALCAVVLFASSSAGLAAADEGAQAAAAVPAKKTATPAPALERDPICGMSVDPAQAKKAGRTAVVEGKTFYFCSDSCKKQFDTDPAKFAAQGAAGTTSGTGHCGCPCCGGTASASGGSNARMCGRRMR